MSNFDIRDKDVDILAAASMEVRELLMEFDDILAPRIVSRLREVQSKITQGLFSVRLQQEAEWNRKFDYFTELREKLGMSTTWSMYDVADIHEPSGITATELVYNGWGEAKITMAPGEKSWLDMWHYAEQVLHEADDIDHGFIEAFEVRDDGKYVLLRTGS